MSGSLKYDDTFTVPLASTYTDLSEMLPSGSGSRFGTVTSNSCSASPPWPSSAVTVTVVSPWPSPVNVNVFPFTLTVTASSSSDSASYLNGSMSGSLKYNDTSTVPLALTYTDLSEMLPSASGSRLGTSTAKLCVAVASLESWAVTVTVTSPWSTPVYVTVLPFTLTVTTEGFEELASYSSGSPSGSWKFDDTSTSSLSPTYTESSEMVPTASGSWFSTTTVKLCSAFASSGSAAVTVTVALPSPSPV